MAANPSHWSVDFATFLRFEREAEQRHELIDGEIIAMAGATRRHNRLCERLRDAIRPALGDGPCELEGSDQLLGVETARDGWVGYYPDLAVYCSNDVHPSDTETRIHPKLLVEVTSQTTEKKDRGIKLENYLQIATLDELIIVSHRRQEVECWTRGANGWTRELATRGTLRLHSGALIDVDRLYAGLPPISDD